jgi:hypothetical protein
MNLQGIHVVHLTTTSVDDAATTTPVASAPPTTLLPEPGELMLGADMGAEIAALAVKTGESQQDVDTKAAEAQDTVQASADAAQVSTMHDEASTMRTGAWTSGLLQMGAGALTIASAGVSVGAAAGSTASGVAGGLKGASEGMSGGSTLAGGLNKAATTDMDANAAASKALADAAQQSGAAERDGEKSASTFVQAAIDFYKEYEASKAQAQAAAVHGA